MIGRRSRLPSLLAVALSLSLAGPASLAASADQASRAAAD